MVYIAMARIGERAGHKTSTLHRLTCQFTSLNALLAPINYKRTHQPLTEQRFAS